MVIFVEIVLGNHNCDIEVHKALKIRTGIDSGKVVLEKCEFLEISS